MIFNSSEPYDVLEGNGLRLKVFTIEPGQEAHIIMTHHPKHKPYFNVHRVAGKVCGDACPEKADQEVTKLAATISKDAPEHIITAPGTYYMHTPEASWMQDPCNPVIVEVHVYDHV